jgi:hypothetical protein
VENSCKLHFTHTVIVGDTKTATAPKMPMFFVEGTNPKT